MGVEQRVSEERLQEIKDSVDFQYTLAKAKCIDNALLFADEEKELIDEIERLNKELEQYKYSADELNEIERLNNIIKEVREYIEEKEETLLTCDEEWLDHDELIDKKRFTTILKILDKGE